MGGMGKLEKNSWGIDNPGGARRIPERERIQKVAERKNKDRGRGGESRGGMGGGGGYH